LVLLKIPILHILIVSADKYLHSKGDNITYEK
jgi:hypothetical protein